MFTYKCLDLGKWEHILLESSSSTMATNGHANVNGNGENGDGPYVSPVSSEWLFIFSQCS